jgi:integrase
MINSADFQLPSDNVEEIIISYDSAGNPFSRYADNSWYITDRNFEISFRRLSGQFKSLVKEVIYRVINEPSLRSHKSMVDNTLASAAIFESCIKLSGGTDFYVLDTESSYRKVLEAAKSKGLRYKTWKNALTFLFRLKSYGYIKRDIGNADKLAVYLANSKYTKQTMAIPEKVASAYFSRALDIVEKYHPHRTQISELYKVFVTEYTAVQKYAKTNVQCRQAALEKVGRYDCSDIEFDYMGNWLSLLRGACYVVLAAFTGCRDGEVKSFNLLSYQEKEYAGMKIPILNGIHTKPNMGGVARAVSWVTIPAAKKAIELLWDSFDFARTIWKKRADKIEHPDKKQRFLNDVNKLFLTMPTNTAVNANAGRQAIDKSLRTFVKFVAYKATTEDVKEFNLLNPTRQGELKTGEILVPHPHAFRRTFAVFLVRNKLGSLLDIKYQYKHMNIAMSSWYSNHAHLAAYFDMMMDSELQAEIAEENNNYMTDTLYFVYNEAETLAGPEGKRILDLRANSSSTIYLSREEIAQQVKEGRLSIIEHPTGHCTNPRCDRVCDMTTCQYKLVTKDKALDLMQVRERLMNKFYALTEAKVNQPNILSKFYFEIRSIEKVLEEHNIPHSKFSADISVSLL